MIVVPKYRARFFVLLLGLWATVFIMLVHFSPNDPDASKIGVESNSFPMFPTTSPPLVISEFPLQSSKEILNSSPLDALDKQGVVTEKSSGLSEGNKFKSLSDSSNWQPPPSSSSSSSSAAAAAAVAAVVAASSSLQENVHSSSISQSSNQVVQNEPMVDDIRLNRNVHANQVVQNEPMVDDIRLNRNVHAFYYGWYDAPKRTDPNSTWVHWNHEFIQHWNAKEARRWPSGRHNPELNDIGADFFPELGAYSSTSPEVLEQHIQWSLEAGIGVLVFSWYPPGKADENGLPSDPLVLPLLNAAHEKGIKICLHVEPYKERDVKAMKLAIEYATEKYASHPAYYHMPSSKHSDYRLLPVFYVYDSYHVSVKDWAKLLKPVQEGGDPQLSIRDTKADSFVLFLLVESSHSDYAKRGGFDGFYTYFGADGFTYGSSLKNWPKLQSLAASTNTVFVPSVGPGYIDVSVRPWNAQTTRDRRNGQYYMKSWQAAISAKPDPERKVEHVVSVTSFNEWHEGTQIEPAVPMKRGVASMRGGLKAYLDYGKLGPSGYLQLTKKYSKQLHDINEKL